MSFSGQYASFVPDPELNKREWYNDRGGYITRSRFYPSTNGNISEEDLQKIKIKKGDCIESREMKINRMRNENNLGYIEEDRIKNNQPSNFIDFLNYYFKNLLK